MSAQPHFITHTLDILISKEEESRVAANSHTGHLQWECIDDSNPNLRLQAGMSEVLEVNTIFFYCASNAHMCTHVNQMHFSVEILMRY